jgi:hypothetical protein
MVAKQVKPDPKTVEFWANIDQGTTIKFVSTRKHHEEGTPGSQHTCRHVRAFRDFSPVLYDAQVRKGDVFGWVTLPDGKDWCFRFLPSKRTAATAKLYDEGKLPPDDITVVLTYDQRWAVRKKKSRAKPVWVDTAT